MLTVDYAYYAVTYGGELIPAEGWPSRMRDAAAYIDELTMGQARESLPEEILERCKMAICAAADCDAQADAGGEVASETSGKWSRTFVTSGKTAAQKRYEAARRYLLTTGLLYRGCL